MEFINIKVVIKFILFFVSYIYVNYLYANDFSITLKKEVLLENISTQNIKKFLDNINYVYPYLMSGHLEVKLDCKNIGCSKTLYVKEKQDSDVAQHNYRIIVNNNGMMWLSENSKATKWKFFNINFATSVDFTYTQQILNVVLILKFNTKKDFDNFIKYSKNIWENHFNLEIDNAMKVFLYLQNNNLFQNNPETWVNINFNNLISNK